MMTCVNGQITANTGDVPELEIQTTPDGQNKFIWFQHETIGFFKKRKNVMLPSPPQIIKINRLWHPATLRPQYF